MKREFEWDPVKAKSNLVKHQVSFAEAVTVFTDPCILSRYDDEHSELEDRWLSLGMSDTERALLVIHTERSIAADVEIIRLISARRASKQETEYYMSRRPL